MNKKINILLALIIILLVGYILYNKYTNKDNDVKELPVENNTSENTDVKEPEEEPKTISEVEYYFYEEDITPEDADESEKFTIFKSLYLFENGEYYYSFNEYGNVCSLWSKGKYEINDNTLLLKESSHGDCDECYYTKNLTNYSFGMKNNTLISDEDEVLKLNKVGELPNTSLNKLKNCDNTLY